MRIILAFIQNLSLDITAGAIISSLFVCRFFGVQASFEMMLGLGIAIWLIYTADHLQDARKVKGEATNPRHAFHQRYFKVIATVAAVVFALGVYNTFKLPRQTVMLGLILAGLSGLYFLYLRWSNSGKHKEFFAATVYTAGIFTGPVSLLQQWEWFQAVTFAQFFLLASVNLLLFPWFEMKLDNAQEMNSIAIRQGPATTMKRARILLALTMVLVVIMTLMGYNDGGEQFVLLAMSCMLLALILRPQAFVHYDLYRYVGDGIFLIPGLALF